MFDRKWQAAARICSRLKKRGIFSMWATAPALYSASDPGVRQVLHGPIPILLTCTRQHDSGIKDMPEKKKKKKKNVCRIPEYGHVGGPLLFARASWQSPRAIFAMKSLGHLSVGAPPTWRLLLMIDGKFRLHRFASPARNEGTKKLIAE